jgi:glycosyltransferase involved in cell wall biosynthesis
MAEVSVIMPAYNVAEYIGTAIESVQAQTVTDWELLIVDDGCTDDTVEVVKRYAADPRIRLLHRENGGIAAARNTALRESTGRFLAILDSDDVWDPRYLATELEVFARHPDVDIVTGNGWFLGGRRHGTPARPWPDKRPQPTLARILGDEEAIFIMSVMRRRVYELVGEFDERLRSNEDYDYWLRAAIAGCRFLRNDEPLSYYRRREDSISASQVRMIAGILVVYARTRPLLADRPDELRILDAQVARFRRELLAAEAKAALDAGHGDLAATHLSALYDHGGGAAVKLASVVARWAPRLLSRVYQIRRTRQEAAS